MADSKDEILAALGALEERINTRFDGVDGRLNGIDAKLEDIRNDIHVISEAHLAPSEKKKLLSGSSPSWPRAVEPMEMKEK
jgi:hypothetical protein